MGGQGFLTQKLELKIQNGSIQSSEFWGQAMLGTDNPIFN